MSIRYPSLDEFWPAVRARRFVKVLGGKPTKYVENMAFLAKRAGVHPAQMRMVNPITFAERNCISSVRKLLGERSYFTFDLLRNSTWHPSAKWFYAVNEPIPPYVDLVPLAAEAKVMAEEAKAKAEEVVVKPEEANAKQFVWTAADEARHQANLAQRRADTWARCSAAATEGKWGVAPEAEAKAMTLLSAALAAEAKIKAEEAETKAEVAEVKPEVVEVKAEDDKHWGTCPYITDEDLDLILAGKTPKQATWEAIFNMQQTIRNCGIASHLIVRKRLAEKGYYEEELFGYARIPRPFPIDLHSEEGLAAYAAGKPLPHPVYLREKQKQEAAAMVKAEEAAAAKVKQVVVEVKRSWWRSPWLCGMVAVEK
jgi:hypothetical protein